MWKLGFTMAAIFLSAVGDVQAAERARPPSVELTATPGVVVAVVTNRRAAARGRALAVQQVLRGRFAGGSITLAVDEPPTGEPWLVAFSDQAVTRFPDPDRRASVAPHVVTSFLAGPLILADSPLARMLLLTGSDDPQLLVDTLVPSQGRLTRLAAAELVGRGLLDELDESSLDQVSRFVIDSPGDALARELLLQFGMEAPWALQAARDLLEQGPTAADADRYLASLQLTAIDVVARHGTVDDRQRLAGWAGSGNPALAEAARLAQRELRR